MTFIPALERWWWWCERFQHSMCCMQQHDQRILTVRSVCFREFLLRVLANPVLGRSMLVFSGRANTMRWQIPTIWIKAFERQLVLDYVMRVGLVPCVDVATDGCTCVLAKHSVILEVDLKIWLLENALDRGSAREVVGMHGGLGVCERAVVWFEWRGVGQSI